MKTANQGQISVYLCAIIGVMLILIITVLQGIRIWEGKAKCRQALHGAVVGIQADFQPDLFRRYHLLAVDATYYGRGEGYLEQRITDYLDYNLNPAKGWYQYRLSEVAMVNPQTLIENDLYDFHRQIEDYMSIKAPALLAEQLIPTENTETEDSQQKQFMTGVDGLSERTRTLSGDSGEEAITADGPVTGKMIQALGLEEALSMRENAAMDELSVGADAGAEEISMEELLAMNLTEDGSIVDPREAIGQLNGSPLLEIVMPEQVADVSKEMIDLAETPSASQKADTSWQEWNPGIDLINANSLSDWNLEEILQESGKGGIQGLSEVYGIAYAMDTFAYVGKEKDTEAHAFQYEIEYLIMGRESDYDNLTMIARRLCLLRMIPNGAYAFTDSAMKEEALIMATLILTPLGVPELAEPVSYVLLGCWAYGESLLEVKELFAGKTVPLQKNETNWKLSLNGLKELESQAVSEDNESGEAGMNYEQYMMLLLATMPDSDRKYYRMLDVIQLNIQKTIPEFYIKNCMDEFTIQLQTQEADRVWNMQETGGYLQNK